VGSGHETTIGGLIETICKVMDYKGEIDRRPERSADVRRHCANVTKAEGLIGKCEKTTLEQGLNDTIAWYRTRFQEGKL